MHLHPRLVSLRVAFQAGTAPNLPQYEYDHDEEEGGALPLVVDSPTIDMHLFLAL